MSEISLYNFNDNQVRVVQHDGEPWFVAKDVCDVLGTQTKDLRAVLEARWISNLDSIDVAPDQGGRAPLIINESGLYALVMRSRKERAREFRNWVVEEVLPTLRKTQGVYIAPESPVATAQAEGRTEDVLLLLKLATTEIETQREKIGELAPRAVSATEYEGATGGEPLANLRRAIANRLGRGIHDVYDILGQLGVFERRGTSKKGFAYTIKPKWQDILFETPTQVGEKVYNNGAPRVFPGRQDELVERVVQAYRFRFGQD